MALNSCAVRMTRLIQLWHFLDVPSQRNAYVSKPPHTLLAILWLHLSRQERDVWSFLVKVTLQLISAFFVATEILLNRCFKVLVSLSILRPFKERFGKHGTILITTHFCAYIGFIFYLPSYMKWQQKKVLLSPS